MTELDEISGVLKAMGGYDAALTDTHTAHLVASGHRLLSLREVPGIRLRAEGAPEAVSAELVVLQGERIKNPIHFCIGVLPRVGAQNVKIRVRVEEQAAAAFIAHCFFPSAERVRHAMDAWVEVGEGAEMRYSEAHYHGPFGGVEVLPRAAVKVAPYGRYFSDFSLTTGRVGKLSIDYEVEARDYAVAEMIARVFGHAKDEIIIQEKMMLAGKASRGLIKTRVALEDEAYAEVTGMTEGGAEGARGHVDCMEIVRDRAVGKAVPIVKVTHPLAKVTHEAAIGSVDKKQLETLMAHGLSPEEAVNMIVTGLLR